MSDKDFRIIFEGELADGFSLGMVKKNLGALFKADTDRIAQIFGGQAVVLKRGLDQSGAEKYQAALLKAGAITRLQNGDEEPVAAPPPPPPRERKAAYDWSLAPAGSSLLRPNERPKKRTTEVTVEHISMASSFAVTEPESEPPPPAPDVSSITLADTGSDMGEIPRDDGSNLSVADLEASIAPPGSDLLDEKSDTPELEIDLSHLSLSE